MFKRLLERFRQDRGLHKATVRVDFFPQNQVTPQILWLSSNSPEADTVPLILLVYARILYELAELNEGRVARELIRFLDQVCDRVLDGDGPPQRPRLPLGQLTTGGRARPARDQVLPGGVLRVRRRRLSPGFSGEPRERGLLPARGLPGPAAILPGPPGGRRPAPPDPGAGAPPPLLPLSPGFLGRRARSPPARSSPWEPKKSTPRAPPRRCEVQFATRMAIFSSGGTQCPPTELQAPNGCAPIKYP